MQPFAVSVNKRLEERNPFPCTNVSETKTTRKDIPNWKLEHCMLLARSLELLGGRGVVLTGCTVLTKPETASGKSGAGGYTKNISSYEL